MNSISSRCRPLSASPVAQKALSSFIRRSHMPVYSPLVFSNRSRSYFSLPKARTTRTPVRFSWATEDSSPSLASTFSKLLAMPRWKNTLKATTMGMNTAVITDSRGLTPIIKYSAITICTAVRISVTNWSARKLRTVSTSEVQRWMMSPVWFELCQDSGSRTICPYSRFLVRLSMVSWPRAFIILNPQRHRTDVSPTATMAAATTHRCSLRYAGPPRRSARRRAKAGRSGSPSPSTVSTV